MRKLIAFNGSADQHCEKNVKMNFLLWANRGFLGKRNCIFTITSKDKVSQQPIIELQERMNETLAKRALQQP